MPSDASPLGVQVPPPIGGLINPTQESAPPAPPNENERQEALLVSWESVYRNLFATTGYIPDQFLREKGWDALDNMLTLAPYEGPLRVKKYATLYQGLKVIPFIQSPKKDRALYDRSMEMAEFCQHLLDNIYDPLTDDYQTVEEVLWYLCDAFHYGFSCQELVWRIYDSGPYKGYEGLERVIPRNPRQIRFWLNGHSNRVEAISSFTLTGGYQWRLPTSKFLLYTYGPKDGLPFGQPDSRRCYKHVYAINEAYRIWGVALERFAAGFLHLHTQNNSKAWLRDLMTLANGLRQGGSLITTGDVEAVLHQVTGSASPFFTSFVDHHCDIIVKLILGQQLTTGIGDGKGSYSLGDVHQNTQEYFFAYCRKAIQAIIRTQLFRRAISYNYGPEYLDAVPFASLGQWNTKELQAKAEMLATASQFINMHPDEDIWREEFDMPPLQEGLPTVVERDERAMERQEQQENTQESSD